MLIAIFAIVAGCFAVRQEALTAFRIIQAQCRWVRSPARVIVAREVRQPWHASTPYRSPRHIAAAEIQDSAGRRIVVERMTLCTRDHAAVRHWIRAHNAGDKTYVYHPSGRPDLGVLLAPSSLWFQAAWRVLYVLAVFTGVVAIAWGIR